MRPIVDLNNMWYSKETLVYNSRINIIWLVIIEFFIIIVSYYVLKQEAYFFLILFIIISFFLVREILKSYIERIVIQLKINSDGVSVKNSDIISWGNIENIRIKKVKVAQARSEHNLIFFDSKSNQEIKFRVERFCIGVQEIIKCFEIHNERYKKRNFLN